MSVPPSATPTYTTADPTMQQPQVQTQAHLASPPIDTAPTRVLAPVPEEKSTPFYHKMWFYLFIFFATAVIFCVLGLYTGSKMEKQLMYRRLGKKMFANNPAVAMTL